MADYPSTSTLTDLDPLTPAGTEVAAKIDDAIRQIKYFLVNYLAVAHNADGTHKNSSVSIGSLADNLITLAKLQTIATNKVLGRSTAGTGNVELLDATTAGLALLSAANAAAQRTALGLGSIALVSSISATELATDAVETAKIKDLAVTTAKIADSNVTEGKLASESVSVGKMKWSETGSDATPLLMIRRTGATAEVKVGGVLTASYDNTTSPPSLKFAMASTTAATSTGDAGLAYARLEEQKTSGTGAGAGSAAAWTDRSSWSEHDPIDLIGISGAEITFKKKGVYRIDIKTPVSGAVGAFRSRLVKKNGASWDVVKVGSSGLCGANGSAHSHIIEVLNVAADDTIYKVQTYIAATVGTSDLGAPVSTGDTEIYTIFEIIKL